MRLFTHVIPSAVLWAGVFMASLPVTADDTEIYFSSATADNSDNKIRANVMIMLDTSGSMRFCEEELGGSGFDANWCSDYENRRINMLQGALDDLLDQLNPNIRVGLGRYNYRISGNNGTGQLGGRILVPVVDVNETTKARMREEIAKLNDAGENASAPADSAQPVGDTPTGRAYSEAARYMMGMTPVYGVQGNVLTGDTLNPQVCVAEEQVETNCRNELVSGGWAATDWCDVNNSNCRVASSEWAAVDSCDLSQSDCRLGDYVRLSGSCNTSLPNCYSANERYWFFGWRNRTVYFQAPYQGLVNTYEAFTEETFARVCDTGTQCTQTQDTLVSGRYSSPINTANQCETNHIVLFTDGVPSNNDIPGNQGFVNCGSSGSYACQQSIAQYLISTGNAKGVPVKTHNIGLYMGDNQANMAAVSDIGQGNTINAESTEDLLNAFLLSFDLIADESRSITAPGIAVNTLNRFQNLDELYYAVFQPVKSSYWEGNLKRYRLNEGAIQGLNGNAIDPATGFFREGARSFWSAETDGSDVVKGGARSKVGSRSLFYTDEPGGALKELNFASVDTPSDEFLGLGPTANESERLQLLAELRSMWGDPLHSQPLMVNYGGTSSNNTVFVSTNGGMLHAINAQTGGEHFAFMPFEFISRANEFTIDRPSLNGDNTRQTYGLDGSWISWRRSGGSILDAPASVYLYGGMRRGGESYYGLDVTDLDAPSMLWQINSDSDGFEDLGQTWSTPTLTSIPYGEGRLPVLVFGGGYSPDDHDNYASRTSGDEVGNAIYIVNAVTGELVWSAGSSTDSVERVADMKWAVPGGISVVDIDFDGKADHLYFGDLGGQVFRVDIDVTGNNDHDVSRLASLGGSGFNHRRFYEAPAVGYVRDGVNTGFYVALASGYRAHPLDESTREGLFVIKDKTPFNDVTEAVATTANMSNVSDGGLPSTDSRGWYYYFDRTGEKSMASPVIFDNRILLTTYSPVEIENADNPCAVSYGRSYLHTVRLTTAEPAGLTDEIDGTPPLSRSQALSSTTPAPTPTILLDDDGEAIIIVGTEVVGEGDIGDLRLRKQRWLQLPRDEANVIRNRSVDDEEGDGAGD